MDIFILVYDEWSLTQNITIATLSFKMSVPFVSSVKIINKTVVNLLLYWSTKNAMEFEKKQRISSLVYLMFYEYYINDLHLYFLSLNHVILVNVVHSSQVIFLPSNYNILLFLSPNTETKKNLPQGNHMKYRIYPFDVNKFP